MNLAIAVDDELLKKFPVKDQVEFDEFETWLDDVNNRQKLVS